MSKPCKPSEKFPLDTWECNPVTGRYVKIKDLAAEKAAKSAAAEKKKLALKAKIEKLTQEAKSVKSKAAEKCAELKKKAAEKAEQIKETIAGLKGKPEKWVAPFAGAQLQ
jgi:flagellar biosynthesis GTPase FlhF